MTKISTVAAAMMTAACLSVPARAARAADDATQAQLDQINRKLDQIMDMLEAGRGPHPAGRPPHAPPRPGAMHQAPAPEPQSGRGAEPPAPIGTTFGDLVGSWTEHGPPSIQIVLGANGDINMSNLGGARFVPGSSASEFVMDGSFQGTPFECRYTVVPTSRSQASWTVTRGPHQICPSGLFDRNS